MIKPLGIEERRMHLSQWTALDFLFALIILVSTIFALTKGFVREIISLVALIGGFALAALFYPVPAARLVEFSRTDSIANLLGFLIIFLGCILAGAIISFVVNRFLKAASLKWVDRLLGGVFGLLRGWAVCSIMVIAVVAFPVHENIMARSFLAPYLLTGARTAVILVPKTLKEKFNEQYQKILQTWSESRNPV
jgi:membrane protein required for colicin V production